MQINIDPETLIPKLPKPRDLQPYPTTCLLEYRGHSAPVTTLSTDSSGEWLATGTFCLHILLACDSLALDLILSCPDRCTWG